MLSTRRRAFSEMVKLRVNLGNLRLKLYYEVVEAFFLNSEDRYLEVEFGPHGQHIALLLDGRRNAVK